MSIVMGALKADGGKISVLGHKADESMTSKIGYRIGFMPQKTALINELTIKETIYFFGNINGTDKTMLHENYRKFATLFELPRDDRSVEDCSGGEQRRISFCATIIHNPELLILDEPTVGLDPLLREKIWDFLVHETKVRDLAIIISTHYIEEARQADYCGMMRNGVLLVEDSPRNILAKCQSKSLENAFLKLCTESVKFDNENNGRSAEEKMNVDETTLRRDGFDFKRCAKLIQKDFLQLVRQPS